MALAYEVQTAVNRSNCARRRDDIAIVHIEHVWQEIDFGKTLDKEVATGPVRGSTALVQQTCITQDKSAKTQTDHLGTTGMGLFESFRQHGRRCRFWMIPGRNDHKVSAGHGLKPARHLNLHALITAHFARRRRAVPHFVRWQPCGRWCHSKHDAWYRKVKQADAFESKNGDADRLHGRSNGRG